MGRHLRALREDYLAHLEEPNLMTRALKDRGSKGSLGRKKGGGQGRGARRRGEKGRKRDRDREVGPLTLKVGEGKGRGRLCPAACRRMQLCLHLDFNNQGPVLVFSV